MRYYIGNCTAPCCVKCSLAIVNTTAGDKVDILDCCQTCGYWLDNNLVCCSISSSNCCFLTCIQISQEAGQAIWYSHFLLEKALESPLDSKEIQPIHPKGNQSWIFIGRTDVDAETPILWLPDAKNWPIRKDLDAGKDWRQEEKGMTEDEMVGWQHRLDGHELEQALGVGDGQGSLACFSPRGQKESDTIEQLNRTWSMYLS